MHPKEQLAESQFIREMKAALLHLESADGRPIHAISVEEFRAVDCDSIRFYFWIGDVREESDEYMIGFSSNHSITENLGALEEFVREQSASPE